MGIEFNPALLACGINPNMAISLRPKIPSFGQQIEQDRFESNNPARFTNEIALTKLVNSNPKIAAILSEVGAPVKLNMVDLKPLLDNHCTDVQNIAMGIAENLPFSLQSKVNKTALKEAAYLHDIGKVLIPPEVLNKNGRLNDDGTRALVVSHGNQKNAQKLTTQKTKSNKASKNNLTRTKKANKGGK